MKSWKVCFIVFALWKVKKKLNHSDLVAIKMSSEFEKGWWFILYYPVFPWYRINTKIICSLFMVPVTALAAAFWIKLKFFCEFLGEPGSNKVQ